MIGTVSPSIRRFAAVVLAALLAWGLLGLTWNAVSARQSIARQIDEARENYASIRNRRVDIQSLKDQLARLNKSEGASAAVIEAPNEAGASGVLRQAARAAVESANGKFLTSTEYAGIKVPETVAIQFRARTAEQDLPAALRAIEQGERALGIEELQLASRSQKEVAEVEITAVVRSRWRSPETRR